MSGQQWGPVQPPAGPMVPAVPVPLVTQIAVGAHDGRPIPTTARIESLPGTGFCVAYPRVPATMSGPSIGSLVAGIGSVLVSTIVGCVGLATSVGVAVGGAFAMLGIATGCGAVGLGLAGLRQVKRDAGRTAGRSLAIAGISCGGTGLALTVLAMIGALLVAA